MADETSIRNTGIRYNIYNKGSTQLTTSGMAGVGREGTHPNHKLGYCNNIQRIRRMMRVIPLDSQLDLSRLARGGIQRFFSWLVKGGKKRKEKKKKN